MAERLDDGTEVDNAISIGECILTCVALEENCNVSYRVLLESTFKKCDNVHMVLSVVALRMFVTMFSTEFSFKIGTVTVAIATVIDGIMAFMKNKSD